jgi:SAM-dependent methyltransferase
MEMARLVGPEGTVTGVDMDEVKLALAAQAAAERGVTNVAFEAFDVNDWDEPDGYDVVYSRFVLAHLSESFELLRRMWTAVRAGGLLIVEDVDFGGWSCHPPNDGFDFFLRVYGRALHRRGGDGAFGRKLYGYFLDAEIPEPNLNLVQPFRVDGEEKAIAWLTLEAAADAIVAEGIASENEIEVALASLRQYTDDPTTLIVGPRIFQVWSQRGAV